MACFPPI